MADIFFSYSSADRERVRPVHEALVAQGFDVFWDQEVPAGVDWDSWIRQNLANSKCAVVFWSATSVISRNVRHEATVADDMGTLIPVLLEPLKAGQFPMGLYTAQAVHLVDWNGNFEHEGWRQLDREIKARLVPSWVQQQIGELQAELVAERARRKDVERRDKSMQAQIEKEVMVQQQLKQERDDAVDQATMLNAKIKELNHLCSRSDMRTADLTRRLTEAELRATANANTRHGGSPPRTLIMQFVSVAAALATIGFWTYQLMSSDSPAQRQDLAQRLSQAEEELKRANAKIGELSHANSDKDTQIENLRRQLGQSQTVLKGRGSESVSLDNITTPPLVAPNASLFRIKENMEARGTLMASGESMSRNECESKCAASSQCRVFTYSKRVKYCFLYNWADLTQNEQYDSGVR